MSEEKQEPISLGICQNCKGKFIMKKTEIYKLDRCPHCGIKIEVKMDLGKGWSMN